MKYLKIASVSILFLITFSSCNRELVFEKLEQECFIKKNSIGETFLVHHWNDSSKNEKSIDEFACRLMEKYVDEYSRLEFTFYRATRKTNVEYIKEHPNQMTDSYVNDYLWHYTYSNRMNESNQLRKTKLKNMKGRKFFFPEVECIF